MKLQFLKGGDEPLQELHVRNSGVLKPFVKTAIPDTRCDETNANTAIQGKWCVETIAITAIPKERCAETNKDTAVPGKAHVGLRFLKRGVLKPFVKATIQEQRCGETMVNQAIPEETV